MRFLEARWGRDARTYGGRDIERVVDHVRATAGVSLEELVHAVGDPDLVYWAILHRHVHVDLAAHFVSHSDQLQVFVDASAAAAWSAAVASVGDGLPGAADVLARSALARYPPEAQVVALERYQAIRSAIENDLPTRTFTGPGAFSRQRWLMAYRKARREGGVGLVGLCPKDSPARELPAPFSAGDLCRSG